ncbi:MAG: hypothetical protein WBM02_04510 [bacterium]
MRFRCNTVDEHGARKNPALDPMLTVEVGRVEQEAGSRENHEWTRMHTCQACNSAVII